MAFVLGLAVAGLAVFAFYHKDKVVAAYNWVIGLFKKKG